MAKDDATKIFLAIFLLTLASKGVLATMDCFTCTPSYGGTTQSVIDKANAATTEIKRAKSDVGSCDLFVAGGVDQLNRANPKLKVSGCDKCVKIKYQKGSDKFVGRGCMKSGSNFTPVIAATAIDDDYSIMFCDNKEYCNAAPSHFTGTFFSMVISLVALSLKKFM